ncbi:MAG: IreB family regulatory phosphoprotein [Bacillota bacterium]|nr:IreB family regulatory phosphoprotein [Bacillota bacterium]
MTGEFQFGTFSGDETMAFDVIAEEELNPGDVLNRVYDALSEKGYNPINQLVGYLISGDPAYITSYKQARSLIRRVDRDDLIEELVSSYLKGKK